MNGSDMIHPNKVEMQNGVTYFYLGSLTALNESDNKFKLISHQAEVLLHFLTDSAIRIKLSPKGVVQEKTTDAVFKRDWQTVSLDVRQEAEKYTIRTNALTVQIKRDPLRIEIFTDDGRLLTADDPQKGMGWNDKQEVFVYKTMQQDEHFYGFGEKAGFLNKRGTKQVMWNSDVYAPHNEETNALYESIPFFISHSQHATYGIFLDNPSRTEFDLSDETAYSFKADAGDLDYYFFYGGDIKDVVQQYTELTGKMPLPPKWALGYQQSRYSYQTEAEVREVAQSFREKQIPCDVIYLDIHYMDDYRVFTWHPSRFPEGEKLINDLKEQGFHVVPIVDPGVKKDPNYRVYQEGVLKDYFCKYLEGEIYTGDVWPGESAFPDFTETAVREWWADLHQHYTDAGIKGIWNDMNEPAVFNETKTMDLTVMHRNDGEPKTHQELHNLYGYYMSKATYCGLKEQLEGKRPFVVTRAGYAGIQRYAAIWTGDNRSFWEHLAMSIPMFLNMGLSGLPFVGSDIGGFAHPTNGSLLARWMQLGAFTPFCRNHSALDVPRQEPWVFGSEIEAICKRYIELRYRFMPHFYNLFYFASQTGLPILRPLVMEYPQDTRTYDLSDQLMVGESILLAPVYRPDATHRIVYLPEGSWVNYWTEALYEGEQTIMVESPLDTLPMFIKAGSVLALGPVEQYAGEIVGAPLQLHIYWTEEQENLAYTLYEDDAESFAYEKGEYNQLHLSGVRASDNIQLHLTYEQQAYQSMREVIEIHLHLVADKPRAVEGEQLLDWHYDQQAQKLVVKVKDSFNCRTEILLNF